MLKFLILTGLLVFIFIIYAVCCLLLPPKFKRNKSSSLKIPKPNGFAANGERVCVIDDNEAAFLWRIRLIHNARHTLVLTTFDFRDDQTGQSIMAALLSAANRGVHIRLLIDGADGQIYLRKSKAFQALVSHNNVEAKFYNPVRITALWRINYRLHEKYLIMDSTAYILGGRNTQDVYLSNSAPGAFHDRDVVVYEEARSDDSSLEQVLAYFETVWNSADCVPRVSRFPVAQATQIQALLEKRWGELCIQYGPQLSRFDWLGETMRTNGITFMAGSPVADSKPPVLWRQICQKMCAAQSHVIIQTPFVMCGTAVLTDLTRLCRQVKRVQILTNTAENCVNPLGVDYANQRMGLLKTGAQIYEYAGDKPIHAKTILIDDSLTLIGSYNLDNRSAYLDTEVMLLIDCPALNQTLHQQIETVQTQHPHVTPEGTVLCGVRHTAREDSFPKKALYAMLKKLLPPFEYLL